MKFLLDESADLPLAETLRLLGHDVKSIARDFVTAVSDETVLAIANAEHRILITNDRDFGELVYRRSLEHAGIILFRLGNESLEVKAAWLREVLRLSEDQFRHFIVVTDRAIRVRHAAAEATDSA